MTVMTVDPAARMRAARAQTLSILIGASVMLSLAMGMRQSLGLFMGPISKDLGLGAAADRWGHRIVMVLGVLAYAAGLGLTLAAGGPLALTLGAGLLVGIALSCGGASLAMSASA